MEKKLIIVVLAVICASQAFGAPSTYSLNSDKQTAQYGVVKLLSEITILRMRVYLLVIELNNTIKNMNVELFQLMLKAGVATARVDVLKKQFTTEINKATSTYVTTMDKANKVLEHLQLTNNHIAYKRDLLPNDIELLEVNLSALSTAFAASQTQLNDSMNLLSKNVNTELSPLPVTEDVQAVYESLNEHELLLRTEKTKCDEDKVMVDITSVTTKHGLQNFVNLHVPTTTTTVVPPLR